MQKEHVDVLIGGIFVAFFAADRFNTPASNRSSTTAVRYYTAAGVYCLFALLLYSTVVRYPHLLQAVRQQPGIEIPAWVETLSAPLFVALLLTVLLPKVPMLSHVDDWIRSRLQYIAAIPHEVRRLCAQLADARFAAPEPTRRRLLAVLPTAGFDPVDLVFEATATPQSLWTKIAALMAALTGWDGHSGMAAFRTGFPVEFGRLRHRYEQLTPRAVRCFELMHERETPAAGRRRQRDAVSEYQQDFERDADELLQQIYEFLGRGVLSSQLTHSARREQLCALGFRIALPRSPFTLDQLVALFVGFSVLFMTGLSAFTAQRLDPVVLFLRSMMIATIYVVSVCCAIYPRRRWLRSDRVSPVRPFAFYLVVSLLAAVVATGVSIVFKSLLHLSVAMAMADVAETWPWALLTFAITFVTAFMIDDVPSATLPASRLRWVEGSAAAAILTAVATAVHALLRETMQARPAPDLVLVLVLVAIIGLVIGTLVPTWYRTAPRQLLDAPGASHGGSATGTAATTPLLSPPAEALLRAGRVA
jgi:hypothetical protein